MSKKFSFPSAIVFQELRRVIPTIPPRCKWLTLTLTDTECTFECEVYVREDDIAQQTTNTPDQPTT